MERRSSQAIAGSDILFAAVLALLSAFLSYRFASGNQHEQIPIVLRQLDPGYLVNDFFVSTSVEFGPRLYFARLVAWICQVVPLPWAYAALTFVSDLALVMVTQWAARRIIGAGRVGAGIAAVLTVAVSSFHLGDATELRYEVFQPASLAMPGMLAAVGLGWLGRPIAAAIVASIASLPHPLYGVQGGAIALCTGFVALAIRRGDLPSDSGRARLAWRHAVVQTALAAGILGLSVLLFWWWPLQGARVDPLSTEELFDILARFRSPHHYLPSQFRPQDYVTTAFFCFAAWLAFEQWARPVGSRTARVLLVPVFLVGAGCIAGTLFTEVWPLGAVLTLQPFRLLSILKWSGYLVIGWMAARYWDAPSHVLARPVVAVSLLSAGGTFPIVTALGLSLIRFSAWLPSRVGPRLWMAMLIVGSLALWLNFGSLDERVRLTFAVMLGWACSTSSRHVRVAVVVAAAIIALGLGQRGGSVFDSSPLRPVFSTDDLQDVDAVTARAAAAHSPTDGLFVVPPDFSILRLVGQRALVVDFEAIPLQDRHMREWRERIRQVYGEVEGGGVAARARLQEAYHEMTDERLRALASRYGATHAVLFATTPTSLPELYANDTYRIVRLP